MTTLDELLAINFEEVKLQFTNDGLLQFDRLTAIISFNSSEELIISELAYVKPAHYRVFVLGYLYLSEYPSPDSVVVLNEKTNTWYACPLDFVGTTDEYASYPKQAVLTNEANNFIDLTMTWYLPLRHEAQTALVTYKLPKAKDHLLEKLEAMSSLLKIHSL